ncbi:flavin reductase family protein [Microbacterium sp. LWH7-1.2]|jgi:flavin reductase (DIM6/NTAB) family NADH-FMN oxidoreductase RutF|uniref:flavin reductase family protein n=2 Tax=Microbacterium sp. LWH7-1.2 TaxID=3135257 RepID=UPI0031386FB5
MYQTTAAVSADQFKSAFRNHPAGVAIVTATDNGRHVAMTVSSLSSLSAEPPLIVFSVSDMSSSTPVVLSADSLVVQMLDAECAWLAKLGAERGADRFGDPTTWSTLSGGEPYFVDAPVVIRARVIERVRAGSSTLCVVEAVEIVEKPAASAARPLVYHNRTWHELSDESALRD